MALSNPLEAFVWGRGGAKMTPEQIAREREIAASLSAIDTSPVGHWTQGAARMVNSLGGVLKERRANAAEAANASASGDLIARMLSGGNSDFPAAPGGGGSFPAAPGSGGSAATGLGDPNGYRDAIASVESAGSGDYSAVGPTHKTMGRALGRYQVMEANIGPWSKAALGREVTPEEFMANPQIQDAIFDHQFGSYVQKYGNPQDAASAWFTGQPLSKGANRRDVLGTSGAGYVDKFNKALGSPAVAAIERQAPIQVASLDPGVGMQTLPSPVFTDEQARSIAAGSTIPNYRPGSIDPTNAVIPLGARPMPEEYAATGLSPEAWERMNATDGAVPPAQSLDPASARVAQAFAADAAQPMAAPALPAPQTIVDRPVAEPQQQIAQALMGPNTPLDQVPVMAGGTSGAIQPGQVSRGINPAIIEALSSPYADEQTRKIAGMLLGQQMQANDPAAQLDMRYKQAQIDALNAKAAGKGAVELGLNPQYGVDAKGNPVLIQIGKDGKAVQTAMPDGVSLSKEPIRLDAGTHFVLLDPITRQAIGTIPKENREAARQTAIGTTEGKTTAEQAASAPADYQTAQNALDLITSIRKDPARVQATGKSSIFNAMRGTSGYDFQQKVEQAKSGAFLSAIQQMRGMGALSNAEGTAATAAINRMDTALTEDGFLAALDDYEKIVRQAMERAGARLPEGALPPAPAAGKRLKYNPATGGLE